MGAPFARIAVVGTGLIGGSLALAVRDAYPDIRITGWDKSEVLERAASVGVIDDARGDLREAVSGSDLIYIALPVGATIERLPEIAQHASPGALVTDASSTKRAVCRAAEKCFASVVRFVGGHPMAGNEVSGLAAADAMLFKGARYALIDRLNGDMLHTEGARGAYVRDHAPDQPADHAPGQAPGQATAGHLSSPAIPRDDPDPRVANLLRLIAAIGARPIWMDAATHDHAVAMVSHLPQMLAVALGGLLNDETHSPQAQDERAGFPLALAGRGLRDTLRLAGSPYSVWRDIVLTNTDNLDAALDRIGQRIEHLRANLRQRELESEFAAANEIYNILRGMH